MSRRNVITIPRPKPPAEARPTDFRDLDRIALEAMVGATFGTSEGEVQDDLRREVQRLAAELAGEDPSPAVALLARVTAICWAELRRIETLHAVDEGTCTLQHRLDRAHRRLMATLKTLATVRRLAVPAVHINVVGQQVNQLITEGLSTHSSVTRHLRRD